jgi:hypothetical protein
MHVIAYNGGYKYQLAKRYSMTLPLVCTRPIYTEYIKLIGHTDATSWLQVEEGYAWDGPSGPCPDLPSIMRGSLVHDALYQLMRDEYLDHRVYREKADAVLRDLCLEDGLWPPAAWLVYWAVRAFADPESEPSSRRPLTYAGRRRPAP